MPSETNAVLLSNTALHLSYSTDVQITTLAPRYSSIFYAKHAQKSDRVNVITDRSRNYFATNYLAPTFSSHRILYYSRQEVPRWRQLLHSHTGGPILIRLKQRKLQQRPC